MNPDFSKISFDQLYEKAAEEASTENAKRRYDVSYANVPCLDNIMIKNMYDEIDIKPIDVAGCYPGFPPFLGGPYHSMYLSRPWTIRQYAGFSTAEESNMFYKKCLAGGQKGLSVAFDLPTHRGYDSDHEDVAAEVGVAGVAVDSVLDMEILFDGIPLDQVSVSMTMNGAVLPILAFYIVAAEQQGVNLNRLHGTIQNDILKEYIVRNTFIYPPKHSMQIVTDIIKYVSKNMPKYNSVSISGYHLQEAGATADLELAYTLANGLEYVRRGIDEGIDIDDFAPRLSFFWGVGRNLYVEIAKLRAARVLWAKLIKQYNPANPKSMAMRCHCQTSGWSLTAQDPYNNIVRTTVEALAAVCGHTQSLHTNSLDEALALPSEHASEMARNTQLILQHESDLCKAIDPMAGSYLIEWLTDQIMKRAWEHIEEIEKNGGMVRAIEKGIPKMRIEEVAVRRQAMIDNGSETIVGVNKYLPEENIEVPLLENNAEEVRRTQAYRLNKLREERDNDLVKEKLSSLQNVAETGRGNLLEASIDAARAKATLGEISQTLDKVFTRYKPNAIRIQGVYMDNYKKNNKEELAAIHRLSDEFETKKGRRPRIQISKLGQDGHDRGWRAVASSFADFGFDVDLTPLFERPKDVAKQAVENDVHVLGLSMLSGGHKIFIPELINEIKKMGRSDIMIVVGGVIPTKDIDGLKECGVAEVFGPGTLLPEAAKNILNKLMGEGGL